MIGEARRRGGICRVLSLDGGGAKGFYTLGVLREVEALLGHRLCDSFELIYGTSTGAIIAALIGLGHSVDDIERLYRKHVIAVMGRWSSSNRSAALEALSREVFKDLKFDAFITDVGIVGTRWLEERPVIFKTSVDQAFTGKASFEPGFGCTIGDAVVGSCSAYPFFRKKLVTTSRGETFEVRDGGFAANNPALYALVDATGSMAYPRDQVRLVSVGVGDYPAPRLPAWSVRKWAGKLPSVILLQKTMQISTVSMKQLSDVLFRDVATSRIDATFTQLEMATDMLESDPAKLDLLWQRGRDSGRQEEARLLALLS